MLEFVQYPVRYTNSRMAEDLLLSFPANDLALRDALAQAMAFLRECGLQPGFCGNAELVLAEAMNNIIEHAYAGRGDGQVDLRITFDDGALAVSIEDTGAPMPGGEAPQGRAHDLDCDLEDLPEGGFGWFLIRQLSEDLAFSRIDGRNRLSFRMYPDEVSQ